MQKSGQNRKTKQTECNGVSKNMKEQKDKNLPLLMQKIFFTVSGGLFLTGCIITLVEYIKIQRDRFTSFPAWVAFVFYLLPCSVLALIFLGAAFLCGFINKKTHKITAENKAEVKNLGMTYGEKIYTLREKSGMSQEELAEKLDVSRQTISNWENDKVKIDIIKAKQLCDIFHISIEEFCKDDDESFSNSCEKEEKSISDEQTNIGANKQKRDIFIIGLLFVVSLFFVVLAVVQMIQTKTITIGSMIQLRGSWLTLAVCGLIVTAILFHRYKKK